ncbi:hypothetical protein ABPG74_014427 [Tetrahymena malaccensis]
MKRLYFLIVMLAIINCDTTYINLLKTSYTACYSQINQCNLPSPQSSNFSLCNAYFSQYQKVLVQKQFNDYKSIVSRQTMQNTYFQDVMNCLFKNTTYDSYVQSCGQKWFQFIQCSQNKLCSNLYSNQIFFQKWNQTEQQTCAAIDFQCQIQEKQQLIDQYYSNVSQEVQQFINCFTQSNQPNSSEMLSMYNSLILVLALILICLV